MSPQAAQTFVSKQTRCSAMRWELHKVQGNTELGEAGTLESAHAVVAWIKDHGGSAHYEAETFSVPGHQSRAHEARIVIDTSYGGEHFAYPGDYVVMGAEVAIRGSDVGQPGQVIKFRNFDRRSQSEFDKQWEPDGAATDPVGKPCEIARTIGGLVVDRIPALPAIAGRCFHEGGLWHDLPATGSPSVEPTR